MRRAYEPQLASDRKKSEMQLVIQSWAAFSQQRALVQASGDWKNAAGVIFPAIFLLRALALGLILVRGLTPYMLHMATAVVTALSSRYRLNTYVKYRRTIMAGFRLSFFAFAPFRQVQLAVFLTVALAPANRQPHSGFV